jgi:F1F0 ATPase subunit 2
MYPVILELTVTFITGVGLGLYFFGVLLWTTNRIPHSRFPFILTAGSLVIRFAGALAVFYLLSRLSGLAGILAALFGFILTKFVFIRMVKPGKRAEVFR